jgi:hypothetical protein
VFFGMGNLELGIGGGETLDSRSWNSLNI